MSTPAESPKAPLQTKAVLKAELIRIKSLKRKELLKLWEQYFGKHPACGRAERMVKELSYRMQEQCYGKLDKSTALTLARHARTYKEHLGKSSEPPIKQKPRVQLQTGSIIKKSYKGKELIIEVRGPRAFHYEGSTFRSLSALARAISTQHVSGPLFFNLKEHHGQKAN